MSAEFLRKIKEHEAKITVLCDLQKLLHEYLSTLNDSIKALEIRVSALESPKPANSDAKPPTPRRRN